MTYIIVIVYIFDTFKFYSMYSDVTIGPIRGIVCHEQILGRYTIFAMQTLYYYYAFERRCTSARTRQITLFLLGF